MTDINSIDVFPQYFNRKEATMRPISKILTMTVLSIITACQAQAPAMNAGNATTLSNTPVTGLPQPNSVVIQIDTGAVLKTLAAKKTSADIDHYHLKLVNATTGVVIAEGDSNSPTSHFDNVPNGTYLLKADAIDVNGNSIVQGGEQTSINTVVVNSPTVTYSDGAPCLKVTLHLLDGTGETVGNKVHVVDGQDWTGPANLVDGGDCPCPTPTPTASPVQLACFGQPMEANHIYTVIGKGALGGAGDGGLATNAEVAGTYQVAVDPAGNLYLPDYLNYRIRMVPRTSGTFFNQLMTAFNIYTIAGPGSFNTNGNAEPISGAYFNPQYWVSFDSSGNLFVTDGGYSSRVRMIPRVSGTYYGIAMQPNYIYVIAGNGGLTYAGDGGPASSAALNEPFGPSVFDSLDNMLICDHLNSRIRVVARVSGTFYGQSMVANNIYTIIGGGASSGDGTLGTEASANPQMVATDHQNNVYYTDGGMNRVRMVPATNGTYFGQSMQAGRVYTIAGTGSPNYGGDGGLATQASISTAWGVSVDSHGNVLVADTANNRVRLIAAINGTFYGVNTTIGNIYTIAGDGAAAFAGDTELATTASLKHPTTVSIDTEDNLYIGDSSNGRIRMVPSHDCQ